ncbi:MAG: hypothetical protein AAF388_02540 [Bacteroidota bacterium]
MEGTSLSERLRLMAFHLNITPNKMGKDAGVNPTSVGRAAHGISSPQFSLIEKIYLHYEDVFDSYWVLTGKGKMLKSPETRLSEQLKTLPPDVLEVFDILSSFGEKEWKFIRKLAVDTQSNTKEASEMLAPSEIG